MSSILILITTNTNLMEQTIFWMKPPVVRLNQMLKLN